MKRNGYLWTSGVMLDTTVRFADPDFLLECKISAIWRRFPLIFAFYMPNVRTIYFRFVWPTDLGIIPHASTPTLIIPTKFEAPIRRSVLELWVITFPIGYHWKCVRGQYACAESRHPRIGGQKQLHFWNPRPRFAYTLYYFYWATTTTKWSFTLERHQC